MGRRTCRGQEGWEKEKVEDEKRIMWAIGDRKIKQVRDGKTGSGWGKIKVMGEK